MFSSYCNITLNIMCNLIFLYDCTTILYDKYSFLIIFVYFIVTYHWKSLFLYFNTRLTIKTNQMVITDNTSIILAFKKDSINFVSYYTHIFLYFCSTNKFFIWSTRYSIFLTLLYLIKCYWWKSTIDLNSLSVLTYYIPWYFRFTC